MKKIILFLTFVFYSIFIFCQDTPPSGSNFKTIPTYSFKYYTPDSTVWMYKGSTYNWTKLNRPDLSQYAKIDNPTFTTKITTPGLNIPTSATLNYFWKCINATTGAGQWTAVSASAQYKGAYDASGGGHGSPALTDGTGTLGDYYTTSVAGTVDCHSGNITLAVGDQMYYNGSIWEKIPVSVAVNLTGPITSVGNATSIASQTGTGNTFAMSASPTFGTTSTGIVNILGNDADQLRVSNYTGNYFSIGRVNATGAFLIQGTQTGYNNILLAPNSGNIGIGIAVPSSKLSINGDIKLTYTGSDMANYYMQIVPRDATPYVDYDIKTYCYTPGNINTHISLQSSSGYVGIGTTTPGTLLDVNGVTTATRFISSIATGTSPLAVTSTTVVANLNADQVDGYHGHAAATVTTTNGLSISGQEISLGVASTNTHGALTDTDWNTFNNKADIYWTGTSTNLVAATGRTSLGLGTAAVQNTGYFDLSGVGHTEAAAHVAALLASAVTFASTVTATNFILSSDRRLKENIRPIKNLSKFDIDFVQFNLKSEPDVLRYGVIAQDVEKVAPELVHTDSIGMKSVAYIDLLIVKIQQLENRVKKLEKDNARQIKRDRYFYNKLKRYEK